MRRLLPDLLHVALADEWAQALAAGTYTRSTRGLDLADVGFLHASFAWQVQGVLDRYYRDADDALLLLRVDPALLRAPVRVEAAAGGAEGFPHLYGPLDPAAVVEVAPLTRTTDGWRAPAWLAP